MNYLNVRHIGTTTHEWKNALDFYEDDLSILDQRLLEVAAKNSSREVGIEIEHFQNQFSIQRQNIRRLKHRISANEMSAAADVRAHANHVGLDIISDKAIISGDIKRFETTMKDLRQEFNSFLSKWM